MMFSIPAAVVLLAASAYAQTSKYCPVTGTCITVNVPSSGSSDLFFQMTAPSSMSYVGFGQGTKMSGANIFIMYANSDGSNVTLSPRLGSGHVQPTASTASTVTLLAGSGISGGVMTANVLCSNCQSWSGGTMDFTSTSTNWIYGYKAGNALSSNSVSATITKHDSYGTFSLDLATATGGNSDNPFLSTTATTSSAGSSPTSVSSGDDTSSNDSTSSNESPAEKRARMIKVHGFIAVAAFLIIFPAGGIVLRALNFPGLIWLHVGLQMVGYAGSITVLVLGVIIARNGDQMMLAHPLIGIVVTGALMIQPALGFAHHLLYKARGTSNVFTQPHIWWGRIFVTLGIINGGLGLQLTGGSMAVELAYTAISAIIWVVWMASAFIAWKTKRVTMRDGSVTGRADRLGKGRDGSDSEEMVNFGKGGSRIKPTISLPQRPARDDDRRPVDRWREQSSTREARGGRY